MLSISAQQQQQQPAMVVANTTPASTTTTTTKTDDNNCDDKMKSDRTVSVAASPSESEMIKRVGAGSCGGSGSPRISVAPTTTSVQVKAAAASKAVGDQLVVAAAAANGAVVSADAVPLRGSRSDKQSVDGVEQLIRRLQIAEEEVFDDLDDDDPYAELEYYLENVKVSDGWMHLEINVN